VSKFLHVEFAVISAENNPLLCRDSSHRCPVHSQLPISFTYYKKAN